MAEYRKGNGEDRERRSLADLGIIHLSGAIDDGAARQACEQILQINMAGEADQIQMIVNSSGGSCTAGFAIVDLMEWSRIPVYTTGLGQVASMGLLVFMAGDRGHRVLTPRTSVLSHRFTALSWGSHSQLVAQRREEDLMHRRIVEHYLRYSAIRDEKELMEKLLRDVDTWLTPDEAVTHGIADVVERLARRGEPIPGGAA